MFTVKIEGAFSSSWKIQFKAIHQHLVSDWLFDLYISCELKSLNPSLCATHLYNSPVINTRHMGAVESTRHVCVTVEVVAVKFQFIIFFIVTIFRNRNKDVQMM